MADPHLVIPRPLDGYPSAADSSLLAELIARAEIEPLNAIATGIFLLAILHTFGAARFAGMAHRAQHHADAQADALGRPRRPSLKAEVLHFFGEVEVVFGLWAVVLLGAIALYGGWEIAKHYVNDTVNYTEPLFVVVIMALASTRPVIVFAQA
ncbi:MAG: putative Na+/H+ antiporter, partial [Vicinamibacterales bacterium]